MVPPRPNHELEDQDIPQGTGISDPSLPDTAPLDQESTDDIPLYDMFSSATDRDTSNSIHTSVSLSQDELDNADRIITTPTPPVVDPDIEKQASVSSWLFQNRQLNQTPTPTPGAGPSQQNETRALSEVTGFSQLSSHNSDTISWLGDADTTSFTRGKFLLLDQFEIWMAQILMKTHNSTTVPAAETLRKLKTRTEEALQMAYASGCLIDPNRRIVDKYSERHAVHHFSGQLVKKFKGPSEAQSVSWISLKPFLSH